MDKLRARDILARLESFAKIERQATDEAGYIAFVYSCTRAEAEKMIREARKKLVQEPA